MAVNVAATGGQAAVTWGASVFYVSHATGNDTNAGSIAAPFKSISAAVVAADATSSPCLIKVDAGTYTETIVVANRAHFIEGTEQGQQAGSRGVIIKPPSDVADGLCFVGTAAQQAGFRNLGFAPFSTSSIGRALLILGAPLVKGSNISYYNGGAASRSVGGTFLAVGHAEGCSIEHMVATGAQAFIRLGIEADCNRFVDLREPSQCYQILDNSPYEAYRTPLTGSGITTSGVASTASIGVADTRFLGTSFGVVMDPVNGNEGLSWTGTSGTALTGVSRAIVGYLKNSLTNIQTTGIVIIPLGQGSVDANRPGTTTVPGSGTVTIVDAANGNEGISYTSLTNNGDGTFTLGGTVTRGVAGPAVAHAANLPAQDAALASCATHAVNTFVVTSLPGVAGAIGGGNEFNGLKSVASTVQTAGDFIMDIWSAQTFRNIDASESSNPSTIKVRNTVTETLSSRLVFDGLTLASQTSMLVDGAGVVFRDATWGAGLTLSASSSDVKFEGRCSASNVTDSGVNNDLGTGALRMGSNSPQSGTTYTFALLDANRGIEFTNAASVVATIPPHSSVAFPVGTVLIAIQHGAGQVSFAAGAGVTVEGPGGIAGTAAQYATATAWQIAVNEWIIGGNAI